MSGLAFLRRFVADPVHVGAVAPSSSHLAKVMVEGVGLESADVVAELGPGTGAFTSVVAARLKPGAHFLAVERSPEFAQRLQGVLPGVEVVCDSAENLPALLSERGWGRAALVVSGLPWAGFDAQLQKRLLDGVLNSMSPGAYFTTFAYIHASRFPAARRFRRTLHQRFDEVTATSVVWRNLPPAFVYRCRCSTTP